MDVNPVKRCLTLPPPSPHGRRSGVSLNLNLLAFLPWALIANAVSLSADFDELVEAVRAAADAGDFAAYIETQGGANVPRDTQTPRTARHVIDELNEYDEEVQKIIGIFAPRLRADHVHEARTTQW